MRLLSMRTSRHCMAICDIGVAMSSSNTCPRVARGWFKVRVSFSICPLDNHVMMLLEGGKDLPGPPIVL